MPQVTSPSRVSWQQLVAGALRALIVFDTAALLFAGTVHFAGARIPLGVAVFVEPAILPAGIVESAAGLIFAIAAFAVFAGRHWSWGAALTAHLFAIAGFLLGIAATIRGTTTFNRSYHIVMLAVFVMGLALLLLPGVRAELGGDENDGRGEGPPGRRPREGVRTAAR